MFSVDGLPGREPATFRREDRLPPVPAVELDVKVPISTLQRTQGHQGPSPTTRTRTFCQTAASGTGQLVGPIPTEIPDAKRPVVVESANVSDHETEKSGCHRKVPEIETTSGRSGSSEIELVSSLN